MVMKRLIMSAAMVALAFSEIGLVCSAQAGSLIESISPAYNNVLESISVLKVSNEASDHA